MAKEFRYPRIVSILCFLAANNHLPSLAATDNQLCEPTLSLHIGPPTYTELLGDQRRLT